MVAGLAYAFLPFHVAHAAGHHPRRADPVAPALPAGLVALRRPSGSPPRAVLLLAAAAAVALSNFYGGLIAAVAEPGGARRLGVVFAEAAGREPVARRWRSPASRSWRRRGRALPHSSRRPRGPAAAGSARLPPLRPLPLQREMVELPGPRGRAPAGRILGAGVLGSTRVSPRRCWSSRWAWAGRFSCWPRSRSGSGCAERAVLAGGPHRPRPGERRRGGPPLLALSRAHDRVLHVRATLRAAVRGGADVPGLRAVRRGGRPHDRAAGGRGRRLAVAPAHARAAGARPPSSWAWPSWSMRRFPPWRWRDVLPTRAHRWLAAQSGSLRVLDCAPPSRWSDSLAVPLLGPRGFAARRPAFRRLRRASARGQADGDGLHARRGAPGQPDGKVAGGPSGARGPRTRTGVRRRLDPRGERRAAARCT